MNPQLNCLGTDSNGNACARFRFTRGLCPKCYNKAHHLVKTGQTTWEQLEQAGQAWPPVTKLERNRRFAESLRRLSSRGGWEY
jgi:hypothetical protein